MSSTLQTTESGARTARARRWPAIAVIALGAIALGACTPGSASGLPFTASVSATATPTDATHFALTGTGVSPQLGHFTYAGTVEISNVDAITGVITDTLTETLTTANGSTMTILCHQVADPTGPGTYSATDQWTITGGTGHLLHAAGSGTGHTDIDLNTGSVEKTMTGSITFHS